MVYNDINTGNKLRDIQNFASHFYTVYKKLICFGTHLDT